jgi:fibrillarin-like pre-rRNA processing protein
MDVLYQDVAQRDQPQIFVKNLEFLRSGGIGYLVVKARSEDVAASPSRIYEAAKRDLEAAGLTVLDLRVLAPYQEDHAALVVRKP